MLSVYVACLCTDTLDGLKKTYPQIFLNSVMLTSMSRTGGDTTPFIPNHFVPLISGDKINCNTGNSEITINGNLYNLSVTVFYLNLDSSGTHCSFTYKVPL